MDRAYYPPGISGSTKVMEWRDCNPANLETAAHDVIVTAIAAVHCMESMLWEHCHALDAFDDGNIRPMRNDVSGRLKELGDLYLRRFPEKVLSVWISGNPDEHTHGVSNYDVEDDIRNALGDDGISYDSESGWFVMHCTEGRKQQVLDYIAENHPYMVVSAEPSVDLEDGAKPPMISSWTSSAKWLQDRNLTATIVLPAPEPKTGDDLEELLDAARTALRKTGLSLDEAKGLL